MVKRADGTSVRFALSGVYFLFLSSFLTNSERSGELEENEDEKKIIRALMV